MIRILVWDDENKALALIKGWLSQSQDISPIVNKMFAVTERSSGQTISIEIRSETLWSMALLALLDEGPWDIVISDMLETAYVKGYRQNFIDAWNSCTATHSMEIFEKSELAVLQDEYWQRHNMWGTGLLMLSAIYDVTEIFIISQYVGTDSIAVQTDVAQSIALALSQTGCVRSGFLVKRSGSHVAAERLIKAVLKIAKYKIERSQSVSTARYKVILLSKKPYGYPKNYITVLIEEFSSGYSSEVTFMGDSAFMFLALIESSQHRFSRNELAGVINRGRRMSVEAERTEFRSAPQILKDFLKQYNIVLLSELEQNTEGLCRVDNNVFCAWSRGKSQPKPATDGYTCYTKTATEVSKIKTIDSGFCPKRLSFDNRSSLQDIVGDTAVTILTGAQPTSVRNQLKRYETNPAKGVIGFNIGFSGREGIIETFQKKGGYAAFVIFEDKTND